MLAEEVEKHNPNIICLEPPDNWYQAVRTTDMGIFFVTYSPFITEMDNGEMKNKLGIWTHQGKFLRLRSHDPSLQDPLMIERVQEAEEYIQAVTGFHPELLAFKLYELQYLLEGKHEAPIGIKITTAY